MALRNGTLEKLLQEAYGKAPKKGAFLDEMGKVPGVLANHESEVFCDGYVRALQAHGLFAEGTCLVKLISQGNTDRTFVVKDVASFQGALEEAKTREVRSLPTPRKVQVKMVVERMMKILEAIKQHNQYIDQDEARRRADPNAPNYSSGRKRLKVPELSSRAAYAAWTQLGHNDRPSHFYHADKLKDILERDDIPEDVYPEAWDVCQVREVMNS